MPQPCPPDTQSLLLINKADITNGLMLPTSASTLSCQASEPDHTATPCFIHEAVRTSDLPQSRLPLGHQHKCAADLWEIKQQFICPVLVILFLGCLKHLS